MRTEIKNNGITDVTVLIADEGKTLRRIATGEIYGDQLWLGYTYYINGVKLNPPHLDVPEDFEEVIIEDEIMPEEALQIITGQWQ